MVEATNKHAQQLKKDTIRKQSQAYQQNRRSKRYTALESSSHHYGATAQQPDISREELNVLCDEYYTREVAVSSSVACEIEQKTRGQSDNLLWFQHRHLRITASNFGKVAKRRSTTPVAGLVKTLLYTRGIETKALRWGRTHEDDARQAYLKSLLESDPGATVSASGLVIDATEPCLGCSPDGLVNLRGGTEPDGVVEFKCPYTASQQNMSPAEACKSLKTYFCKNTERGPELKRNHDYFYQVQGTMAITRRRWCDFVVWTAKGMSVERLHYDPEFWKDVKVKLVDFYRRAVLPELALPRHTSGQPIRDLRSSS